MSHGRHRNHICLIFVLGLLKCFHQVRTMAVDVAVVSINESLPHEVGELDTSVLKQFQYDHISTTASTTNDNNTTTVVAKQVDGTSLFHLPSMSELGTFVSSDVSVDCFNHTIMFLQQVQQLEFWALEMLDASSKIPSRILKGNLNFWGSYSECVNIRVNFKENSNSVTESRFTGQYCTVALTLDQSVENASIFTRKLVSLVTRNMPQMPGILPKLGFGLCVPSSCSTQDVLTNVRSVLRHLSNSTTLEQAATVQTCQTKNSVQLDTPAITVSAIWSIFAVVIIVASIYETIDDLLEKRASAKKELHESRDALAPDESGSDGKSRSKGAQLLLCFSVVSNAKKFIAVKKSGQNLFMLEGMRFLSMTWIVMGHTYFLGISTNGLWDNIGDFVNVTKVFLFQTVIKGVFAVDTFLFLSGLLLVYVGLRRVRDFKNPFGCFFHMLIHRLVRIAPVYYMLVAWVAGPSDYVLQGGPQWPQVVQYKNDCLLTWWKSVLFISNFGDTTHMCAPHTWYISLDTQLFIVGCILLILLQRWRNFGIILIVLCILASCCTAFVISYLEHIPSSSVFLSVPAAQLLAYSTDFYIKPYCRMGPYGIGMLLGYLLLHGDEFKTRIKPLTAVILWFVAATVNLSIIYGTYSQFLSTVEPTVLQGSIYNALSGTSWSLGLGWMVYACYIGYGGFVSSFLSCSFWIPLSRLSYSAYLLHYVVEYTFFQRQETQFHFDQLFMVIFVWLRLFLCNRKTKQVILFLGLLVLTCLLSFVFSLAFEVPFINMERIFTSSPKKAPKQQNRQRNVDA